MKSRGAYVQMLAAGCLCAVSLPLTLAADPLIITNVSVSPDSIQIDWNATTSRYIVARSPSLSTEHFAFVGHVLTTYSADVTNDNTTSFYRIRQVEAVTFPDPNFEAAVRAAIPYKYQPTNHIYDIDVESITVLTAPSSGISNVAGIAWMAALTNLDCSGNALTHLDISMLPNLAEVDCSRNMLSALDLPAGHGLKRLRCQDNTLHRLNASVAAGLTELDCGGNSMTNLDIAANGALTVLNCINNGLSALELSGKTNLVRLECSWNPITNLNLTDTVRLEGLWCNDNELTHLDVSASTEMLALNCSRNSLTNLITPAPGDHFGGLYCYDNQLTTLDISGNTNLMEVYAHDNPLVEIVVWDTNNLPDFLEYSPATPWVHEP